MAKNLLEMKDIIKEFPGGVRALDHVDLQVEEGSIHALCGENGAGKSTLMNVLSGIYPYGTYEGDIIYDGQPCKFQTIRDSEKKASSSSIRSSRSCRISLSWRTCSSATNARATGT